MNRSSCLKSQSIFNTPQSAWKRLFRKFSPSTETSYSPVKQKEMNLEPVVLNDEYVNSFVWILNMSEQFYFDNSIMLIYKYKSNDERVRNIIRHNYYNYETDEFVRQFSEVSQIGTGAFGTVFKMKHLKTNTSYAVKLLVDNLDEDTDLEELNTEIIKYLEERNYLITARDSPYVVKFFYSLQMANIGGLFLFFEWCIGDLSNFKDILFEKVSKSYVCSSLWMGKEGVIDEVFSIPYREHKTNFYNIMIVYIFEMFCALEFLAKCNIVHQDIKSDNIMISSNRHLKIADFGLVYNTKFITIPDQVLLVKSTKENISQSSNLNQNLGGCFYYRDMEMTLSKIPNNDIVSHPDRLDYDLRQYALAGEGEFLSDLWATGIIATEMLFGNFSFLDLNDFAESVKDEMRLHPDMNAMLHITYLKSNYLRFVRDGFRAYGGSKNQELTSFLSSIFTPRIYRAENFLTEKEVYRYSKKVTLKHIDISKVEQIDVFKNLKITSNNAFLFDIDSNVSKILSRELEISYQTFPDLLETLTSSYDEHLMNIKPGININYV